MATITVVSPKTIFPGADSFFMQATEADSTTVAALRWVLLNSSGNWAAVATDPAHVLGTNLVAGANITSGKSATDLFVYVPRTVVEANSNSTGTDPTVGQPTDIIIATNAHQSDVAAVTTAASATNIGTAIFTNLRLSPKDASGDTNIRMWLVPRPQRLQFHSAL